MKFLREINTLIEEIPLIITWQSNYNGFSLDVDWENAPDGFEVTPEMEDAFEQADEILPEFMPDPSGLMHGNGIEKLKQAANTIIKKQFGRTLSNMKVVSFEEDPDSS